MTNTTNSTNNYTFREGTQQTREASLARTPVRQSTSRTILPISETPSLVRPKEHDCDVLETSHTTNKVAARLFHSLFRFCFSHAFSCHTKRGHTHLNGAKSSCGGCEAGHAALSPTLYDDILNNISLQLPDKPFSDLGDTDRAYLTRRFKLTTSDIDELSNQDQNIRTQKFIAIAGRLIGAEKQGTFVGTTTEKVRNATYDNPRDSNKFDCHLEHHLRLKEDELAEKCRETLTPVEALDALQTEYRTLVETAISNLKESKKIIADLESAWQKLLECQAQLQQLDHGTDAQKETFNRYLQLIEPFLTTYDLFFTKRSGSPSLKKFQQYLKSQQSPRSLSIVLKRKNIEAFQMCLKFFKLQALPDQQFQKAKGSIATRLDEAEHQLLVLQQSPADIKLMFKHLFGTVNSEGVLVTPTKNTIAEKITDLVQPVTPTRSDLRPRTLQL